MYFEYEYVSFSSLCSLASYVIERWSEFLNSAGVESYDIDLEQQKVTVKGNVQPDVVLQTVSKTGKATAFWEAPPAEAPAAKAPEAEAPAAEAPVAEPEIKPSETVAAA